MSIISESFPVTASLTTRVRAYYFGKSRQLPVISPKAGTYPIWGRAAVLPLQLSSQFNYMIGRRAPFISWRSPHSPLGRGTNDR